MDRVPYRATVFLRSRDAQIGQMEMIEREFAREGDAAVWCRIMAQAKEGATGAWIVARVQPGRSLTIVRASGINICPTPPELLEPAAGAVPKAAAVPTPGRTFISAA